MERLVSIIKEMGIPYAMTTSQKGKHQTRPSSAICFREATTFPQMGRFITGSARYVWNCIRISKTCPLSSR